jgi:AraC-like DNA-binding protein
MHEYDYMVLSKEQSELFRGKILMLLQNFMVTPTKIEIYDSDISGGDHQHPYWELRFTGRYENSKFEKFILIPPGIKHFSLATSVYNKSLLIQLRSGYFQAVFYNHKVVDVNGDSAELDLLNRIVLLLTAVKKAQMQDCFLEEHTKILVLHLIKLFQEKVKILPLKKGHTFIHARNYLWENRQRADFSVSDIAKYLGVSPAYLSKLFKKHVGISAQRYLIITRLQSACELLADGCTTTGDIANLTGWKNHSYFSWSFKRILGISPREFYNKSSREQRDIIKKMDDFIHISNKKEWHCHE